MKRLAWLLWWRASQLALSLGLVVLAAALAFSWLTLRPLEQHLAALTHAQSLQPQVRLSRMEREMARPDGPRHQLAGFYRHFEAGGSITDLLAKLYDVAKASGIEMQRADYRMLNVAHRKLNRYQIIVPVQGDYRTMRVFIASALRELPTMSLDHVQFQRKAIGDRVVDAQVTFSFHLPR
jgi:hypothetical protein